MSEKALRYNEGKPELAYVLEFGRALEAVSRVCEAGGRKYNRGNWKKGGKPDHEYFDSCMRHLRAHHEDELYDPETGCLHAAQAMWNLMAYIQLNAPEVLYKPELDKTRDLIGKKDTKAA